MGALHYPRRNGLAATTVNESVRRKRLLISLVFLFSIIGSWAIGPPVLGETLQHEFTSYTNEPFLIPPGAESVTVEAWAGRGGGALGGLGGYTKATFTDLAGKLVVANRIPGAGSSCGGVGGDGYGLYSTTPLGAPSDPLVVSGGGGGEGGQLVSGTYTSRVDGSPGGGLTGGGGDMGGTQWSAGAGGVSYDGYGNGTIIYYYGTPGSGPYGGYGTTRPSFPGSYCGGGGGSGYYGGGGHVANNGGGASSHVASNGTVVAMDQGVSSTGRVIISWTYAGETDAGPAATCQSRPNDDIPKPVLQGTTAGISYEADVWLQPAMTQGIVCLRLANGTDTLVDRAYIIEVPIPDPGPPPNVSVDPDAPPAEAAGSPCTEIIHQTTSPVRSVIRTTAVDASPYMVCVGVADRDVRIIVEGL